MTFFSYYYDTTKSYRYINPRFKYFSFQSLNWTNAYIFWCVFLFAYRLQINRDSAASLIALIAVKPDHPVSPPVFCLNLHWNGEYNLHNSEYIRYLEKTINYGFVHLLEEGSKNQDKYQMLGLQIKKLMSCCDVLLESWQLHGENSDNKQDFAREKIFIHTVR